MTASIHRRVLQWVMGALVLGASLLLAGSWWALSHEMNEVFADNLKQVALAVATHYGSNGGPGQLRIAQQLPRIYEENGKFEFVTAVWTPDGKLVHSSEPAVSLPFASRSGLTRVSASGESWHLYTIVLENGVVQAAQRARERESLARESASATVLPALALLGLVAVLITLALRHGLAPLSRAAGEIATRSVEALHPIPLGSQPPELHLLIAAINDLMGRLGDALALQRHFVADAAHELRTPITALRLQLQLLERASDDAQRRAALQELRSGITRAQHMVEQLLQLSRLGPETPALKLEQVELGELVRASVGRFSARAEQQQIDLGAVCHDSASVAGDAHLLMVLLDNLVDNALRHTPPHGRIDVIAGRHQGHPCLWVVDSGPGIPAAERERVFDRFYRLPGAMGSPGSGLGLAIVRTVAERHGATVELDEAPAGGLRVTVVFQTSK